MLRETLAGAVDLLSLHARNPARYPFLLQSVADHPLAGRFDILFAFPQAALSADSAGRLLAEGDAPAGDDFFECFDEWVRRTPQRPLVADLPFSGGWFLFLAYEAAALIEPCLRLPAAAGALPIALAVRCPAALVFDRQRQCCELVAEDDPAQLAAMSADLEAGCERAVVEECPPAVEIAEEPPERYLDGIARIHEYLKAGDCFQVNLSRGWQARLGEEIGPEDLYRRLRRSNPAPFAGLMRWHGEAVLSSSPERLVQAANGRVQTRPIAGTRPRLAEPAADRAQREALIANLKERAEHVMLIDLERNDLGRVCVPGSVEVSELMTVESYAHVHHIVSNVRGRLRPDVGPSGVLRAVFPGGTISGCPKLRAIEIIAELEGAGRGAYTGSMGYYSGDGRLDTNILIRSLHWRPGEARLRAGGGIVADSDPQRELAEARAKARGLLLALGGADA